MGNPDLPPGEGGVDLLTIRSISNVAILPERIMVKTGSATLPGYYKVRRIVANPALPAASPPRHPYGQAGPAVPAWV